MYIFYLDVLLRLQSPGAAHHVDAPVSPRPFGPNSPANSGPVPPPVAPKPIYKPMGMSGSGGMSANLYQSTPQPYAAPGMDASRDTGSAGMPESQQAVYGCK